MLVRRKLFVELLLPEIKALAEEPGPAVPPETQVFRKLDEAELGPAPDGPAAGGSGGERGSGGDPSP